MIWGQRRKKVLTWLYGPHLSVREIEEIVPIREKSRWAVGFFWLWAEWSPAALLLFFLFSILFLS
jgi:hypothetical protein